MSDLRARILAAVLETLADDDPKLTVHIGTTALTFSWNPEPPPAAVVSASTIPQTLTNKTVSLPNSTTVTAKASSFAWPEVPCHVHRD